jgi:HEAT repeat protein
VATNNDHSDQTSLEHLMSILQNPSSTAGTVYDAAQDLRLVEDARAIEPLVNRLACQSDQPWVRKELVIALGGVLLLSHSDSPEARDLLLGILSSSEEDDEVRVATALDLGHIGEHRALDLLLGMLEAGEAGLTFACIAALGEIGDPRAVDPLIKYLEGNRLLVPLTGVRSLGKLGSAAKRALPPLCRLAARGNDAEKRYALEAIHKIRADIVFSS